MRVRTFRTKKRDACGVNRRLVKLVLKQCLLRQDRVFNNQLEQAGDIKTVQMALLTGIDQRIQQIALACFVPDWAVGMQFGAGNIERQPTAFCQQIQ